MRTRTVLPAIATTLAASLALAACNAQTDDTEDMPEPQIEGETEAIDDEAIAESVPGVEAADPDGETSSTADFDGEGNAEYTDPGEEPEAGDRD